MSFFYGLSANGIHYALTSTSSSNPVAVVTPDQNIIAGTAGGAVIVSGTVVGLTAGKALVSMGVDLADNITTESDGVSSYVTLPLLGSTSSDEEDPVLIAGRWALYLISDGSGDGTDIYAVLNTLVTTQADFEAEYTGKFMSEIQSGAITKLSKDSEEYSYAIITSDNNAYGTDPFMIIKKAVGDTDETYTTITDSGMQVDVAMDIGDFTSAADKVVDGELSYEATLATGKALKLLLIDGGEDVVSDL